MSHIPFIRLPPPEDEEVAVVVGKEEAVSPPRVPPPPPGEVVRPILEGDTLALPPPWDFLEERLLLLVVVGDESSSRGNAEGDELRAEGVELTNFRDNVVAAASTLSKIDSTVALVMGATFGCCW